MTELIRKEGKFPGIKTEERAGTENDTLKINLPELWKWWLVSLTKRLLL